MTRAIYDLVWWSNHFPEFHVTLDNWMRAQVVEMWVMEDPSVGVPSSGKRVF